MIYKTSQNQYKNIIFTKLTPEEKYNLWKEKINQVAAQSLSHEQRSLVLEVSKILSVDIFIAGHTKNQEIINKLAEDFTNRALEHFPNGQLRRYFGNLESLRPSPFEDFSNNKMIHPRVQDILDKSKDELAKRRIECNCRWGWWCDSRCTDNGNCSGNGGKYAGLCGFMLLQECVSVCKS